MFKAFKEMKKKTLSREITVLTVRTTVISMLLLGVAVILVFFLYFFHDARENMEQILQDTTGQFKSRMQYLEERAVIMRHNAVLQGFFGSDSYDRDEAEAQLAFSADLFSNSNLVSQSPFLHSIYLFNSRDEFLSEEFYPMTVSETREKEESYRRLAAAFRASPQQYCTMTDGGELYVCFRIFDEQMQEVGICVMGISRQTADMLLAGLQDYDDAAWAILSEDGTILTSYGPQPAVETLLEKRGERTGSATVNGASVLYSADTGGFGTEVIAAVGRNNVYILLKPIMVTLLAAFLLAMALAVITALAFSYRFTRPLNRLAENIRAFGQEDFDVRMEDYPIQEFHDIGVVFNEMAEKLQYLITQVYERQLLATKAQVKYLQSQINPHFQSNILSMLSIRAKSAGDEELYRQLLAFSRLTQGKIFRRKNIRIRVAEEMELVEFYLYLQKGRFQDKISYDIRYGSESVKEDLIPRLLIEPLVENAVSHGIEPKNGSGHVLVDIFERGDRLHILVEDDGVGFDQAAYEREESPEKEWNEEIEHTHTGLENTRRLLHVLYGGAYRMDITRKEEKWTCVEVEIPIERGEDDVESDRGG